METREHKIKKQKERASRLERSEKEKKQNVDKMGIIIGAISQSKSIDVIINLKWLIVKLF